MMSSLKSRNTLTMEKTKMPLRSSLRRTSAETQKKERPSKNIPRNSQPENNARTTSANAPPNPPPPTERKLPSAVELTLSYGGRFKSMSIIRRYFLSFVFLDLSLHLLAYLLYLKHARSFSISDLVGCQMKCYDIGTSFVDVIMIAIARFVILETTYGLGNSSSWYCSALTTALTNVFIIVKPFQYDWRSECQKLLAVSIILLSFVLPWLESFLVDHQVIEMENLAQKLADVRPEVLRKNSSNIGFFKSLFPITRDLLRSITVSSYPANLLFR